MRLSNEQYGQSGTAGQLATSVARAVTRRSDLAFVAETGPLLGVLNAVGIVAGGVVTGSLDHLVDLIATLQSNLSTPSHILVDPIGWGALRKLKTGTAYNSTLLGAGTEDAVQMLLSLPVLVNPAVPPLTGLVIDRTAIVSASGGLQVATSLERYFESDSVALRATWRSGHQVVRPNRIGKFTIAAGGS